MNRARVAFGATLVALATRTRWRSGPQAPPMKSVLAGKKFTPPIKGEAVIEFTQPVTKSVKDMVVPDHRAEQRPRRCPGSPSPKPGTTRAAASSPAEKA